jgi:hypothetical protein
MGSSIRRVHLDRGNGTPWCFVKGKALALGGEAEANCEICFKQRRTAPGPDQLLVCSACKEEKPGAAFFSDPSKRTGRDSYCSACRPGLQKKWRHENPELYAAKYKRARDRNPERHRAKAIQQIETKPKAVYAVAVIRNEIKRGRLQRGPCETCGTTKYVHGHHDDYDRPLVVRWLCPTHHTEWHDANGPGANIEGEPVFVPRASERTG